jgi:hypothetical protein
LEPAIRPVLLAAHDLQPRVDEDLPIGPVRVLEQRGVADVDAQEARG